MPKDWKKQPAEGAVQFSKEDAAKGTYWVQVIKGEIKVLLHYPGNKINAANTDVDVMCSAALNVFVALFKKGDSGWIEIIAADKIMRRLIFIILLFPLATFSQKQKVLLAGAVTKRVVTII